jgi:hypothetical protein
MINTQAVEIERGVDASIASAIAESSKPVDAMPRVAVNRWQSNLLQIMERGLGSGFGCVDSAKAQPTTATSPRLTIECSQFSVRGTVAPSEEKNDLPPTHAETSSDCGNTKTAPSRSCDRATSNRPSYYVWLTRLLAFATPPGVTQRPSDATLPTWAPLSARVNDSFRSFAVSGVAAPGLEKPSPPIQPDARDTPDKRVDAVATYVRAMLSSKLSDWRDLVTVSPSINPDESTRSSNASNTSTNTSTNASISVRANRLGAVNEPAAQSPRNDGNSVESPRVPPPIINFDVLAAWCLSMVGQFNVAFQSLATRLFAAEAPSTLNSPEPSNSSAGNVRDATTVDRELDARSETTVSALRRMSVDAEQTSLRKVQKLRSLATNEDSALPMAALAALSARPTVAHQQVDIAAAPREMVDAKSSVSASGTTETRNDLLEQSGLAHGRGFVNAVGSGLQIVQAALSTWTSDGIAACREPGEHAWALLVSLPQRYGPAVNVHVAGAVGGIVIAFDSTCAAAREALAKSARRVTTALEEVTRKRVRIVTAVERGDHDDQNRRHR